MRTARFATFCMTLVAAVASSAQEPAATREAPAADDKRRQVLVTQFEPLAGESDAVGPIAETVRRSLIVDLERVRTLHARQSDKVAPDQTAALELGKADGADAVVWGTVQLVEGRIRITGQVLDVARGASAGSFKVTGSFRELFELQDIVAEQVRRRLESRVGDAKADDDETATDREETRPARVAIEVPPSEPIRVRPHPLDPDWLYPPDATIGDEHLANRYAYGPYWGGAYGNYGYGVWPFGYGYGYGGYHYSFYRAYRPLYQYRAFDYTYRGIPDRRSYRGFGPAYLRSFNGPVPLHWYRSR